MPQICGLFLVYGRDETYLSIQRQRPKVSDIFTREASKIVHKIIIEWFKDHTSVVKHMLGMWKAQVQYWASHSVATENQRICLSEGASRPV